MNTKESPLTLIYFQFLSAAVAYLEVLEMTIPFVFHCLVLSGNREWVRVELYTSFSRREDVVGAPGNLGDEAHRWDPKHGHTCSQRMPTKNFKHRSEREASVGIGNASSHTRAAAER